MDAYRWETRECIIEDVAPFDLKEKRNLSDLSGVLEIDAQELKKHLVAMKKDRDYFTNKKGDPKYLLTSNGYRRLQYLIAIKKEILRTGIDNAKELYRHPKQELLDFALLLNIETVTLRMHVGRLLLGKDFQIHRDSFYENYSFTEIGCAKLQEIMENSQKETVANQTKEHVEDILNSLLTRTQVINLRPPGNMTPNAWKGKTRSNWHIIAQESRDKVQQTGNTDDDWFEVSSGTGVKWKLKGKHIDDFMNRVLEIEKEKEGDRRMNNR